MDVGAATLVGGGTMFIPKLVGQVLGGFHGNVGGVVANVRRSVVVVRQSVVVVQRSVACGTRSGDEEGLPGRVNTLSGSTCPKMAPIGFVSFLKALSRPFLSPSSSIRGNPSPGYPDRTTVVSQRHSPS
mgnify:CR=1 FL=1